MSVQITVDPQDVTDAGNLLEQYMSDAVPNGDFTRGTALRDLAVSAIAAIYAFMRADAAQVRQLQSLNSVTAATGGDPEALRDAVGGILSNLFISLKTGSKSRGFAIGHSSQAVDIFIPVTTQFTRTPGVVFLVDSDTTVFVSKDDLIPVTDSDGLILDYEFRFSLVSVATGVNYNIDPGLFASFDLFNPYVTRVENPLQFAGGAGAETVTEVLTRAPTALSVRNLINERSITAVLDDTFAELQSVLVIEMGDPEMQRDLVPGIAPHLDFHVGGNVDIYLRLPVAETTYTQVVGTLVARPDDVICVFRDITQNFSSVSPGDIIRVTAGLPVVPAEFMVIEVRTDSLVVSERAPFPIATDEAGPPGNVTYTIGNLDPLFNDVLADTGGASFTSGVTSRQIGGSGLITLPGGPVLGILDVAVLDPAAGDAAFKSTLDGFVHFPNQVNTVPSEAQTPTQGLQFRTVINDPLYAQSALQWLDVIVGTDSNPTRFDGQHVRVRYLTLPAFISVDNFVRSRQQRTCAAFQLPRGHHPVEVSMQISYKLKATATVLLSGSVIAQVVSDFINAFDTAAAPIDVSAIIQFLRDAYPSMGSITPLTISYTLLAPTGDVVTFQTTDIVSIDLAKQTSGPTLDLLGLSVSARTTRYVSDASLIAVTQGL